MSAITDRSLWNAYWKTGPGLDVNRLALSNRAVLSRLAPALAGADSVVEVGCAPGAWLKLMSVDFGLSVGGIDFSEVGVDITKSNLRDAGVEIEMHQLDFMEDDLPHERWDVAFSLGFIEHFTDLDEVIRRHAHLVKPGGRVAVFAPNLSSLVGYAKGIFDAENMALHVLVDKRGLAAASRKCGLEVEWCDYLGPLNLFFVHWPDIVVQTPARYGLWGINQLLGGATYFGSAALLSGTVGLVARKPL